MQETPTGDMKDHKQKQNNKRHKKGEEIARDEGI
jgi:hypothetical protein